MFLRDACSCSLCRDTSSKQKNFETAQIPERIEAAVISPSTSGFYVRWINDIEGFSHDHESFYSHRFIKQQETLSSRMYLSQSLHRRRLWDLEIYENESAQHRKIDYQEFREDEAQVKEALDTVDRYGLVFLKNVPSSNIAIKHIAKRIGPIRRTFYGSEWDVRSVSNAKNVAYTSKFLDLHMDLLYMADPPGMQILHCMQPCSIGGESLFSDAFHAYELMRKNDPTLASAFADFPVTYGYCNDGQWYQHTHPSVEWQSTKSAAMVPDPWTEDNFYDTGRTYNAINWSPPFQATFEREIGDRADFSSRKARFRSYHAGAKLFKSFVQDEKALLKYVMQEGECVLFDNRRILHGRTEFEGERWFRGAYIDTDAWRSRHRVLRELNRLGGNEHEKSKPTSPSRPQMLSEGFRPLTNYPAISQHAQDHYTDKKSVIGTFTIEKAIEDVQLNREVVSDRYADQDAASDSLLLREPNTSNQESSNEAKEVKRTAGLKASRKEPAGIRRVDSKKRKESRITTDKHGMPILTKKQRLRARKEAKKERLRALRKHREEKQRALVEKRLARERTIQDAQVERVARWRAEERAAHPDPTVWDKLPEEMKRQMIHARGEQENAQRKALRAKMKAKGLAEGQAEADGEKENEEQQNLVNKPQMQAEKAAERERPVSHEKVPGQSMLKQKSQKEAIKPDQRKNYVAYSPNFGKQFQQSKGVVVGRKERLGGRLGRPLGVETRRPTG